VKALLPLLMLVSLPVSAETVAPVPRADGWLVTTGEATPDDRGAGEIELGASLWGPRSDRAPSRYAGTSAFEAGSLPELRATFISRPFASGRAGSLSFGAGAGFSRLERSGESASIPGRTTSGEQSLHLFPLRALLEWKPSFGRALGSRVGVALVPTVAVATRSALEEGGAHFGVPVELEAGFGVPLGGPTLSLGASLRAGRVDWVDVTGFAANAGLRFPVL
jgi:hypothetical protein